MNFTIKFCTFVAIIANFLSVSSALPSFSTMTTSNMAVKQSQQLEDVDDNLVLFEGDIIYDDSADVLGRNAVQTLDRTWPKATVYYKISKEFSGWRLEYIRRAMKNISKASCLRFYVAPENTTNYVEFITHPTSCQSEIGYKTRIQYIKLSLDDIDEGCFRVGTIMHEIMHTLGFYHQHNVPDRSKHITIYRENIAKDDREHFREVPKVYDFKLPYDFSSIMHYSVYAFSENGKKTILPNYDPGEIYYSIGQRSGLSPLDIKKLNILYRCCPQKGRNIFTKFDQ